MENKYKKNPYFCKMKKLLVAIVLLCACALPVPAQETDANLVDVNPAEVPEEP